ncbi:hypothetical protein os1_07350 [Comamonadaceae bacterium OS-1]|nr:hypothetical protein os1_07350 [Comamonadaceae bacterium OS-1]
MVVDGSTGTAVDTGVGALAGVALVAANVSLFIASGQVVLMAQTRSARERSMAQDVIQASVGGYNDVAV